jgi:hypothetical protein
VSNDLRVRALLRAATEPEVVEALERNPGSASLRDRGWTPAWFQLDVDVDGEESGERHFSVVWYEPGRATAEVAEEELEHGLEEVLRNLRDYEGLEVDREDLDTEAVELRVEL